MSGLSGADNPSSRASCAVSSWRPRALFFLLLFHASVTSALSVVLVVEAHDEAKTVGRATSSALLPALERTPPSASPAPGTRSSIWTPLPACAKAQKRIWTRSSPPSGRIARTASRSMPTCAPSSLPLLASRIISTRRRVKPKKRSWAMLVPAMLLRKPLLHDDFL